MKKTILVFISRLPEKNKQKSPNFFLHQATEVRKVVPKIVLSFVFNHNNQDEVWYLR